MRGYIGLGSNLGERERYLRDGLHGLASRGVELLDLSSIWETEPEDCEDPLWFLNMVAAVSAPVPPLDLLEILLDIERAQGRVRTRQNEPRVLDLDLLLLGDLQLSTDSLTLPHPRMWQRKFVLAPLAELAPDIVNPLTGRSVARELDGLAGGEVRRIGSLRGVTADSYNHASHQELSGK